ncbi:MAG: NUDIX hydrolase [bacterium]|nr:NUDIX hydrolase [bacterium]
MAREEKARTRGTAFARVLRKNKSGEWTHALMVYNYRKNLTEKIMTNCVNGSIGSDGKIDPILFANRTRRYEFVERLYGTNVSSMELLNMSRGADSQINPPVLIENMVLLIKEPIIKREGWGLLGGGVRDDETPEEALVREFFEEGQRTINTGDERLYSSLQGLAKEIRIRKEGTSFLDYAIESRRETLQIYARQAKELGVLVPVPRLFEDDPDKNSPVWIFEIDARNLVESSDPSGVGDPANNTTNPTWFSREQMEECGRNYDYCARNGPIHVYSSHLERLEIQVVHETH